jgi:crotonobetainyl-CoA:carnitine CoA-transferase CaiB-like acyl-CoA transferase
MTQLLEDITVLDFTQGMAGSVATMVMSDFGARVIKIEPPGGDPYRAMPSAPVWHRGKKSVILDLEHENDRRQAQKLAESADIVVESFIPGDAKANGVDYDTLSALNPRLIHTSITAFGDRGPYARYRPYESLVSAKSGRYMAFAGQNDREGPNYGAVQVASHAAAMAAVRGTVAALMLRDRTGRGQRVETNLLRAITYYDLLQFAVWQMMINRPDIIDFDPTVVASRPTPIQYLPVRTKDGRWMQLANLMERLFISEIHAIGLGHLLEEPRYAAAPHLDDDPREEMREFILERMQEKTMDEWMELFIDVEGDVAAEPFMTSVEALDHTQVIYNGLVQQVEDPVLGDTRQIGPLFRMDAAPPRIQGPAPQPGQHTEEVLSDLSPSPLTGEGRGEGEDFPAHDLSTVGQQTSSPLMGEGWGEGENFPAHPLEGFTVLDLSTVIAGPVTGSLLAELGARVIRIETLAGDWMRNTFNGLATNRTMAGTQGLSIDLKSAEGREVLNRLLPKVDVVLHNMRPGAPYRVGIGIEQVRELNPDAVYVYLGGYGSSGPHSHRPSMHPIGGALGGGVMAQIGRAGIPDPDSPLSMDEIRAVSRRLGRANEVNPDPNTAMVTATAITMSLYGRHRFGKPQYAETTMIGSNAYVNADHFFDYEGRIPRPTQDANGYGLNALHRLYESSDSWVFLDCPFEDEWQRMCEAMGRSDLLADPRFADPGARSVNDHELISELAAEFARKPALEWERTMTGANVGCVQTEDRGMYHFFSEDPHVEENGLRVDVEHPRFGPLWRYAPILDFSHTSCVAGAGILRGQHTIPILKELGYTESEIHEMRAKKALDWEEL